MADAIYQSYDALPPELKQRVLQQAGLRYSKDIPAMEAQIASNGALASQLMQAAGINMGSGATDYADPKSSMDWLNGAVASAGGPSARPAGGKGNKQQQQAPSDGDGDESPPLPPRRPSSANSGPDSVSRSNARPNQDRPHLDAQTAQQDAVMPRGAGVNGATSVAGMPDPGYDMSNGANIRGASTPIMQQIADMFGLGGGGGPPPAVASQPAAASQPVAPRVQLPPPPAAAAAEQMYADGNPQPPQVPDTVVPDVELNPQLRAAVDPETGGPVTRMARSAVAAAPGYADIVRQAIMGGVNNIPDAIRNPADAIVRAGQTGSEVADQLARQAGEQLAAPVNAARRALAPDPQEAEDARNRFRGRNQRNKDAERAAQEEKRTADRVASVKRQTSPSMLERALQTRPPKNDRRDNDRRPGNR